MVSAGWSWFNWEGASHPPDRLWSVVVVGAAGMAEAVDGDETTRSSSHDEEVSLRKSELEWVAKQTKGRASVRDLAGRFSGSSKAMSQEELAEFHKNQVRA